jgi:CheY-like chemotaxis protein
VKHRILVVDDQPENADSLVRLLAMLGYDAKAVYDGHQAIDHAADFLPDMIFIDIGMPGIDGYQTVSSIRAHKECAHAILIALTGWTKSEDKQHAYENGFDLHVAKPMSMETLKELLTLLDPTQTESTASKIYRLASGVLVGA